MKPHCVHYILYRVIGYGTLCSAALSIVVVSARGSKVKESLDVDIPVSFLQFFDNIKDSLIVFSNDTSQSIYRIVEFTAMGESYILITNRFKLSTYEIIMLYAYRWQVELYFRFIKRTLKGLHLLCYNPRGVQIQFYLYMIAYLLLLSFIQARMRNIAKSKFGKCICRRGSSSNLFKF